MWRHFPTTDLEPGPTVGLGCMQEELGRVYANETVNPPPYTPRTACFPPVKIVILALLFHKFCFQQCLITDKINAIPICTSWALFIQDQLGITVARMTFHFFLHSYLSSTQT